MWVSGFVRPGDPLIEAASELNHKPDAGNEYVLVTFNVTCSQEAGELCDFSAEFELSLVSSSGVDHDPEWFVIGFENMFESGIFSGGATRSGWLVFEVGQGETGLVLTYEELLGSGRAYLAIEQ